MHRLAALLLAAALVLPALPAAGQGAPVIEYAPYSKPLGFISTGPGGFKAVYLEPGVQVYFRSPPAPGSVLVGVLEKAGEGGLTYVSGAVVLTPWGYALLPGVEYIASWGPLVAAWRNGILETYRATPGGLERLGSVDLAGILGQVSKLAGLEVSGGTVCLAGYTVSYGWVVVYASAWDPAGAIEWRRIPWSPARMPVLSACNTYQAGAKAVQPLHGSGLAYVDGYVLTPRGEPLRIPGNVYAALAATPEAVAVVGYNKSITIYRMAPEGFEFEATAVVEGVSPAQGALLLGAAPGSAAIGVAYTVKAGEASPVLRVAVAYFSLSTGKAHGLDVNVSLKQLEARFPGKILNASPHSGWAMPVNGGVLAAFSFTVYWTLEGSPGIASTTAALAALMPLNGGSATIMDEAAYISSAASNGVTAAVGFHSYTPPSSVVLVAGDLEAWARLLEAAGDPPAFIPVMAVAVPGGGWAVVYRVHGPGIPNDTYALGEPVRATGVVYAETSLGPWTR